MKTRITILFAACFFTWSANINAQSLPGEIAGVITDDQSNPLPFAVVSYRVNGSLQGTTADENGHYRLKPLDAGKYTVTYSLTGFDSVVYKDVKVSSGEITSLAVQLFANNELKGIEVISYKDLFRKDITTVGKKFDTEEIEFSMARDPREFVAQTSEAIQRDDGKDINIRGSRSDATQYYVDGIKVIGGFNLPKSAIKEIAVISGGVPAMFGDATGGIVLITTKSYWDNENK